MPRADSLHLLVVLELLQGENVLVEVFLELLICIVDVELLKAVNLGGAKKEVDISQGKHRRTS